MPTEETTTLLDQDESSEETQDEGIDTEELEALDADEVEKEEFIKVNPNDEYKEQLAERHAKEVEDELKADRIEKGLDEVVEEEVDQETAEKGYEEIETQGEEDEDPLVTVKIEGVEQEVRQSQLVEGYQISSVAQKRMAEATRLRNEFEAKQTTLETRMAELEKGTTEQASTTELDEKLDIAALTKEIREGDDEDAEKAIETILKTVTTVKTPDVETLVENKLRERDVAEKAAKQREIQRENEAAAGVFNTAYQADLKKDPKFWDLAVMEDKELQNDPEWQDKTLKDRYIEAGKRARVWLDPEKKAASKKTKTKSKKTKPVKGTSARANLGKDEKAPTRSDVIRELAESRGQQHLS